MHRYLDYLQKQRESLIELLALSGRIYSALKDRDLFEVETLIRKRWAILNRMQDIQRNAPASLPPAGIAGPSEEELEKARLLCQDVESLAAVAVANDEAACVLLESMEPKGRNRTPYGPIFPVPI